MSFIKRVDPTNLLNDSSRAVKIHTWLFWLSVIATFVIMFTPLRNQTSVVNMISLYTVWFLHIDGKQAALAHKAGEESEREHSSDKKG